MLMNIYSILNSIGLTLINIPNYPLYWFIQRLLTSIFIGLLFANIFKYTFSRFNVNEQYITRIFKAIFIIFTLHAFFNLMEVTPYYKIYNLYSDLAMNILLIANLLIVLYKSYNVKVRIKYLSGIISGGLLLISIWSLISYILSGMFPASSYGMLLPKLIELEFRVGRILFRNADPNSVFDKKLITIFMMCGTYSLLMMIRYLPLYFTLVSLIANAIRVYVIFNLKQLIYIKNREEFI